MPRRKSYRYNVRVIRLEDGRLLFTGEKKLFTPEQNVKG